MRMVLASASPRRCELLAMLGADFEVIPAPDGEDSFPELSPGLAVVETALGKGRQVAGLCGEDSIIIAADTIVRLDGETLGKPGGADEARAMLSRLSGRTHEVYTGVAVISQGVERTAWEVTGVTFRSLTRREIDAYVGTGEPMDKAGAYGAQGLGAIFIERFEGDFFNVVGLPLHRLNELLRGFGAAFLQ